MHTRFMTVGHENWFQIKKRNVASTNISKEELVASVRVQE
jgi:hypothetical protein